MCTSATAGGRALRGQGSGLGSQAAATPDGEVTQALPDLLPQETPGSCQPSSRSPTPSCPVPNTAQLPHGAGSLWCPGTRLPRGCGGFRQEKGRSRDFEEVESAT